LENSCGGGSVYSSITGASYSGSHNTNYLPCYMTIEINDSTCTVTQKGMFNSGWSSDNGNTIPVIISSVTFVKQPSNIANISGNIKDSTNAGISGVTVTLSGGSNSSMQTGTNGAYSFNVVKGGNYTVVPTKTNWSFSPLSQNWTNLTSEANQNFTGSYTGPLYSITGVISDTGGVVMNGVSVVMTGDRSDATTTNTSGSYTFSGLYAGLNLTIRPAKTNYTFNPSTQSYTNLAANQTRNFTGTANPGSPTYNLSGSLKYSSGTAISGVTVNLSTASAISSVVTDSNGYYEFIGYSSGTYTVTPVDTGRYYTPATRSYPLLNADTTGQDFTGTAIVGAPTYSISGYIRDIENSVLNAVTLSLSGKAIEIATSNSEGYYQFTQLSSGTYTVTPSKTGFTFSPKTKGYDLLNTNQASQDYIGIESGKAGEFLREFILFDDPLDVTVDQATGDMYVGTTNNLITKYDSSGVEITGWTTGNCQPKSLALDSDSVYSAENIFVNKYQKTDGTKLVTWGSTAGNANNQFSGGSGIIVDNSYVYVADANNTRIQVMALSGGNYTNRFGDTSVFGYPSGICINSNYLYVTDKNTCHIKIFTKDGAQVREFSVTGQPLDIVSDTNGTLYVLTLEKYIYIYNSNGTYIGKWGGSLGTNQGQFDEPSGLGVDKDNNIYVADKNNNRIQVFRGYAVTLATQTYSISGYVRNDIGAGMADVSVSLTGTTNDTAITNASGLYTFSSLISAGNYTVKPIKSRYSFSPSSKTYTSLGGNYTAQNFIGTEVTGLALSGYVKDKDGQYLSGVQLALVGSNNTDTAQNTGTDGYYSFSGLTAGNYTLTPFKHNYIFSPGNIVYRELSADKDELIVGATSDTVKQLNANIYLKLVNNVFNPKEDKKVVIAYNVKTEGKVKVNVYDLRGTLITKIVDDEMNAGTYLGEWDGKDKDGKTLPTGIYLVNIDAPGIRQTKKLCIVK